MQNERLITDKRYALPAAARTEADMQPICEGHSQIQSMSQGMRMMLNRPTVLDEPVLQGDSDADATGASIYGAVIRDHGVFRMWYQAWPRDWNLEDVITVGCVESDDGLNWRRPKHGLVECLGSRANHLTDLPFGSPSVMIDPDAEPSERYRAFGYTSPAKFRGRFPRQVNAPGYFTAHSADGLHWNFDSPDPLWPGADVITSVWDPVSRCARIALKRGRVMGGMSRRAFYTAEWRRGQASEPIPALFPDDYDDLTARLRGFNSADYYGVGLMPTAGPTIGFLQNFRHQLPIGYDATCGNYGDKGAVDISIVYQLERGGCWRHVSGRPDWLSTQNAPEWARGAIYTAAYPLEVGDETWLYFTGTTDRHGWCGDRVDYAEWCKTAHARRGFFKIGLAKWASGRIIGGQADLVERISLTARIAASNRLVLNAVTHPGGRIRVQLLSVDSRQPIPGYGYDDCDPMVGDLREVPVRWRGQDTLPATPAIAEVEITRGILYAFDYAFRGAKHLYHVEASGLNEMQAPGTKAELVNATAWDPGLPDVGVLKSAGDTLDLEFNTPGPAMYRLVVDCIAGKPGPLTVRVDGAALKQAVSIWQSNRVQTVGLDDVKILSARPRLTLQHEGGLGLVSLRPQPAPRPLPANVWMMIGPFATSYTKESGLKIETLKAAFETPYPPEKEIKFESEYPGTGNQPIRWCHTDAVGTPLMKHGLDFRICTEIPNLSLSLCFGVTYITSPEERKAELSVTCDYWANAYLNGEMVKGDRPATESVADGAQFTGYNPIRAQVTLRKGVNTLLVKNHGGTGHNWIMVGITDPGDLKYSPKPE